MWLCGDLGECRWPSINSPRTPRRDRDTFLSSNVESKEIYGCGLCMKVNKGKEKSSWHTPRSSQPSIKTKVSQSFCEPHSIFRRKKGVLFCLLLRSGWLPKNTSHGVDFSCRHYFVSIQCMCTPFNMLAVRSGSKQGPSGKAKSVRKALLAFGPPDSLGRIKHEYGRVASPRLGICNFGTLTIQAFTVQRYQSVVQGRYGHIE